MFKFIAMLILFSISTYVGFYIGESYRQRSLNLNEFLKAIRLLNTEVVFASTPLPEALFNISEKIDKPLSDMLCNISEKLRSGEALSVYDGYCSSYEIYKEQIHFNKSDLNIIEDFFKSLGESGVFGQEKVFTMTMDSLRMNYLEAEKEAKANTKMYRTLGLCTGAILVILFI